MANTHSQIITNYNYTSWRDHNYPYHNPLRAAKRTIVTNKMDNSIFNNQCTHIYFYIYIYIYIYVLVGKKTVLLTLISGVQESVGCV